MARESPRRHRFRRSSIPDPTSSGKRSFPKDIPRPILSDAFIFLTAFEDDALYTYALDRVSGEVRWRVSPPQVEVKHIDARNNAASPSPAVDAERVVVFFPDFGLLAYDFEGKELWRYPLAGFNNIYGMGASPILIDGKVILVCDQSTHSFILALDANDGSLVWRTDRPEAKSGHSTPILHRDASGQLQILVPGSFLLTAYAADDGEKLWWVSGLSFEMKSTPVVLGDMLFINGYGAPENQPGRIQEAPEFTEALEQMDSNGDGSIGKDEVQGHAASWFGFTDLAGDGSLDAEDWDFYQASLASRNGILGHSTRRGRRHDGAERRLELPPSGAATSFPPRL